MREPDYYSILGVDPRSTPAQISRAYRTFMRTHHPDVEHAPADQSELLRIMEAFAVLRNPVRRAEYDSRRSRRTVPKKPDAPGRGAKRDAGPVVREHPQKARSGEARDIPVRRGPSVPRQSERISPAIRVTPVRWESGPWS